MADFDLYTDVERRLLDGIGARLSDGLDDDDWPAAHARRGGALRRWARALLAGVGRRAMRAVVALLRAAYRRGVPAATAERADGATAGQREMVATRIRATHERAVRSAVDVYQGAILVGTVSRPAARRLAVRRALNVAQARGLTGFVDARGRHWTLPTYLTTVVRIAITQAELTGVIDSLRDDGQAVARVRTEPGRCAVCGPWAGKVIRLDGDGPRSLAAARRAGLFHPRCRCTLIRARLTTGAR